MLRSFKTLTVIFMLFAAVTSLHASKVQIILHSPPPNMLGVGDMWNLTLENTTKSDLKIYVTGTATEEKDGLIIEGKSKVFTIKPGRTNYTYNDFSGAEVKYNNGKYKEIILRTGNAPEGSYTICVTAFEESGEIAGMENCIMQTVQQLGSISLISPEDGAEINPDQPLIFSWTPLQGAKDYSLKIVELKGDQSPDLAMKNNLSFLEIKNLQTNSYLYPVSEKKFEKGKQYAWQVKSLNVESEILPMFIIWGGETINLSLTPLICDGCCFDMNISGNFTNSFFNSFKFTSSLNNIASVTAAAGNTIVSQSLTDVVLRTSNNSGFVLNSVVGEICFNQTNNPFPVSTMWSTNMGTVFMLPADQSTLQCPANCDCSEMCVQWISPGSPNFGSVPIGQSLTQQVKICNCGTMGNLYITPLPSPNIDPFSITPSEGFQYMIPPGSCQIYDVTFTPTNTTSITRSWNISHNASNVGTSPYVINLTGQGTAVPCNGTTILTYVGNTESVVCDFGSLPVGPTYTKTIKIKNSITSCDPIDITPGPLTGGEFSRDFPATPPTYTRSPNGFVTFEISYTPIPGASSQNWNIVHTAANLSPNYNILITGFGLTACPVDMLVKQGTVIYNHLSTYDFGNRRTGTTTNKDFKIYNLNTSNCNLLINWLSPLLPAPFSVSVAPAVTNPAGISIPDFATVTLTFNPTSDGTWTAIPWNIGNNSTTPGITPHIINLNGKGIPLLNMKVARGTNVSTPVQANNSTFVFPNTASGSTSTQNFTILNLAASTANLILTWLAPLLPAPFSVTAAPGPITPTSSTVVTVTFAPTASGTWTAVPWTIGENSTNYLNQYVIKFTGTCQ